MDILDWDLLETPIGLKAFTATYNKHEQVATIV
jgi:hypothetical protein